MNSKDVRFMKTPYSTLKAKKNNNSKPFLMISELIDNSIGSWNTHEIENNLNIEITIDNMNKKIICTDNAAGMSKDELLDSVELNKEKSGNRINMFGVGMKNAAFWFGEDLIIETNDGKESNKTSVMLSRIKDLEDPVTWQIEEMDSPNNKRGTTVIIENIYKDRVLVDSEIGELISVIATKYRKYLSKNKKFINITIEIVDKYGEKRIHELKPNLIKSQTIPPSEIENFIKNINNNFVEKENILFGLKDQAIEKAKNAKPLTFKFKIPYRHDFINLEIGILKQSNKAGRDSKNFKPNFGITAYQKERAIRIANVNPIAFRKWNYTRTDIKRVHGSMELGHLFKPDNNKSDFNFGAYRDVFNKLIDKIGNDMILLSKAVADTVGRKSMVEAGTKRKSREKLSVSLEAKSNNFSWDKFNKYDTEMSFVDSEGEKWIVILNEVDIQEQDNKNYFINANLASKNHIDIKYNVNHPIWKPLVNDMSSINLKNVTYPLIIILGLSKIGIENSLIKEWIGKKGDDYLDVITDLAKFGLKI